MKTSNQLISGTTIAIYALLFSGNSGVNGRDECDGLLPDCKFDSIYKCGNAEPVCGGGDLQQNRNGCASLLIVCTPTGSTLVFNDQAKPASASNATTTNEDESGGGNWDFIGLDATNTYNDACNLIENELPDCEGPSYKCGSEAVCGELKEWTECTGNLVVCAEELSVVSSASTSTTVVVSETVPAESNNDPDDSIISSTMSPTTTASGAPAKMQARSILASVVLSLAWLNYV